MLNLNYKYLPLISQIILATEITEKKHNYKKNINCHLRRSTATATATATASYNINLAT